MNVAVFTGPTGGHFYPALAFAQAFQKRHPEARLLLVTGGRGRALVEKAGERGIPFEFLPDFPFPRPRQWNFLIRLFPFLLKLLHAVSKSRQILARFRPDLTVGFGSYLGAPALWLSRRRKIPTLIHEQNRKMGRANAWAARFVERVALSFDERSGEKGKGKEIVTGFPLRQALIEKASQNSAAHPRLPVSSRCRLLILGGSQGSGALNDLWKETFRAFSHEEKQKLAVIHITGEKDYERTRTMYLSEGMEASVFSFHEKMEALFSSADLALTRAGAGTLFELALFGLPAIVIPYPHADSHQETNARYFEARGGLVVLEEKEATPERLRHHVIHLMNSSEARKKMSESLKRLACPEAAENLVQAAEALLP